MDRADSRQPLSDTQRGILNAALLVIGRRGISGLTVRAVSEAANVSRGTIYRYYRNKQEILLAVAVFDQKQYERGVREAVDAAGPGIERLRAHLQYSHDFLANHPARWMAENEPQFLLQYLNQQLPQMRSGIEKTLGDVINATSAVRRDVLSAEQVADLIVRILVSTYLLPGEHPEESLNAICDLLSDGYRSKTRGGRTR